jgi:hypothetical protein
MVDLVPTVRRVAAEESNKFIIEKHALLTDESVGIGRFGEWIMVASRMKGHALRVFLVARHLHWPQGKPLYYATKEITLSTLKEAEA